MSDRSALTRRGFVTGASAFMAGACAWAGSPAAAAAGSDVPATDLSAADAVDRMRRGELSSEAYAKALLDRCASLKALNAFITLEPDRVLSDARAADRLRAKGAKLGPLHGLPIPVKDSLNTRDYPTTVGTPALRKFRPAEDAPLVAQLKSAGALVLGKTNLHELAYGWTSNNHAFGAVHNPYDPSRIPGGSSGGTAAAVAAHMAPLGVAADTEGSIRVPAALCGLVGFRPTTGRYSQEGLAPITPVFDEAGPHARRMGDIELFDSVVTGEHGPLAVPKLETIRLAVYRGYYYQGLDPEVARVTDAALARLKSAGVTIVETEIPELADLIARITGPVQYHDTEPTLRAYLAKYRAGVTFEQLVASASDDIRATFAQYVLPGGRDVVSDAAYRTAVDQDLPHLRAVLRETFARTRTSALVLPTTMTTAPRIGDEGLLSFGGRKVAFDVAMSRNIDPGSTAGLPGLVMPVGLAANGLPVSLEFDGPAGSDRALLGLGTALERVLGTEPPPRI
ncbi:MAG TPA: amidase family protein [Steroidobacteraceae bacterium]|jgi:mandelamide amidase|nr:amidase family protein [Steroidobacteraceae bacterium]